MKKYLAAIFAVLVTVSIPLISLAHPGHGGDDGDHGFTIIHYFTQPVHLAISMPLMGILVWYSVKKYRSKTGNK